MKLRIPNLVAGAATLICFLFLPYVDFMGVSVSVIDLFGELGLLGWLPILAGIAIIIGSIIDNKMLMLVGSIVGAAAMILDMFVSSSKMLGASIFDVLGFGFWLALVGFIVSIILAVTIKPNSAQ